MYNQSHSDIQTLQQLNYHPQQFQLPVINLYTQRSPPTQPLSKTQNV